MTFLTKTWEFVLDILFPPICIHCRRYLEDKEKTSPLCLDCLRSIEINPSILVPSPQFLLLAATSYESEPVKNLIHYFKYRGLVTAEKPLTEILLAYLHRMNLNLENFIIVPVPLHKSRLRERGFNQTEILARAVSEKLNLPLKLNALKRKRDNKPQIEMKNYKDREINIKNCFEVTDKNSFRNKNIILLDDVYTSGATIKEAVKILKRGGATNIIALTVAKV